jgi:hypothetical protein
MTEPTEMWQVTVTKEIRPPERVQWTAELQTKDMDLSGFLISRLVVEYLAHRANRNPLTDDGYRVRVFGFFMNSDGEPVGSETDLLPWHFQSLPEETHHAVQKYVPDWRKVRLP